MDEFLDLLQKSFVILAEIDSDSTKEEIPILQKGNLKIAGERWKVIFDSQDCSLVWKAWFSKYGVHHLAKLDEAELSDSDFANSSYLLGEGIEAANKYQDKNYLLDLTADTIERLIEILDKRKI